MIYGKRPFADARGDNEKALAGDNPAFTSFVVTGYNTLNVLWQTAEGGMSMTEGGMPTDRGMVDQDHTYLQVHRLVVGESQTNCYVLVCPKTLESVILDPGAEAAQILQRAQPTKVKYILLTHGHGDHTGALEEVQWKTGVPIGVHPADADRLPCTPDLALEDGESVRFGEVELKVLHVPGHTPGSVALLARSRLFAGDTVFPGGPGHTRSPEEFQQIVASIREKILPLPDATRVLPGHGAGTTIGEVREEYKAFAAREDTEGLFGDVLWRG